MRPVEFYPFVPCPLTALCAGPLVTVHPLYVLGYCDSKCTVKTRGQFGIPLLMYEM